MGTKLLFNTIILRIIIYGIILFLVFVWIFSSILLLAYKQNTGITPAVFGIPFKNITFTTEDGFLLHGWWIFKTDSNKCIILCHGIGADKSDMVSYMPFLYKAGYSVLAFDFRGHGENKNHFTSIGYYEVKDLSAAVKYVKAKEISKVGIIGRSMGAATSLIAAGTDTDIKAVVSDSSFASLKPLITYYARHFYHIPYFPFVPIATFVAELRTGIKYSEVNPIKSVAERAFPVLIFHGDCDKNIPVENATLLYNAAAGPKKIFIIKGASHVGSLNRDTKLYEDETLKFFKEYLK